MINLDPKLLDQEGIRKRRRKKLLLLALAPEIVLVLTGLFFLRPSISDLIYRINYDNRNAFAVNVAQMQQAANILEPYIAYYNAGTAMIRDGRVEKAEEELRESLDKNPPKEKICRVRINLSYSIEMQADKALMNGDYESALMLLSKAEGVLYADNCAERNEQQEQQDEQHGQKQESKEERNQHEKAQSAIERISEKRSEVVEKINGDTKSQNSSSQNQGGNNKELDEKAVEEVRKKTLSGSDVRSYVRDYQHSNFGGDITTPRYDRW